MAELLTVDRATKTFGGLHALSQLSFAIREGEILGLIGPNGSGKTTLFNCMTGLYPLTSGRILFGAPPVDLVALDPHEIAERGISRTFQTLRVFPNLTVLENVLVGLHCRRRAGVLGAIFRPAWVVAEEREATGRAEELLGLFGERLLPRRAWPARSLSYANRRRLEISRALATRPRLLLLDEPTAGMNPSEKAEMTGVIRAIRERGVTVLLIEHDMRVVMQAADRVIALNYGERIAEGRPEAVARDPAVVEAYLGKVAGRA
ncbi:MAG TPA: ABC transporter ATP-binding protein [Methylomirabilota bacterium]|nr:ABC transporter ATP-binding protein [Methylomirabilota bacterium]